ncbi:CLUMA_CG005908, isoform A [Clunio marinus]|uniref:Small ribosomal subunit protein uS5m n=1 Tax=Clunio marinus TaxID=568069 RepID=A0A1J1HXT7_9DIPT|nr:CLUMA_CG005908, isoform A [Clunio marinus]
MALKFLQVGKLLSKSFQNLRINPTPSSLLSQNHQINTIFARNYPGFFTKLPADHLWKAVTSVSNAGRKRGRAKGLMRKKNLNRGQIIGVGKANIQWPGLSAPIIRGRELVHRQTLPPDPEHEAKIIKLRESASGKRFNRLTPLERGWSGSKMPGRSIGPPDPIGEDAFEGFDTRVIELKTVVNMKGNMGRKRRLSCFVVTGNGKGLAGFATGKAVESKNVLRKAKNRAGQKLMFIDICDGHGIYHDFFCQFGKTKIFVYKKPEGYGLVCHRAIKTICEVVGIKDLYAKCEGSPTVQHVVKAFFLGLLSQKPYAKTAEAKGLHLVKYSKETGFFPKVVASPTRCRTEKEIRENEIIDYSIFAMDGKLPLKRKKFPMFYESSYGYQVYLKKLEKRRNHFTIKENMLVEHGEMKSFLTDKYPECKPGRLPKREPEDQES